MSTEAMVHAALTRASAAGTSAVRPTSWEFGEDQIGVGVEPPGQLAGVVVEIALDRETAPVTGPQRVLTQLGVAAEALTELGLGAIGDVRDPTCEAEARLGRPTGAVVVATGVVGVLLDGE